MLTPQETRATKQAVRDIAKLFVEDAGAFTYATPEVQAAVLNYKPAKRRRIVTAVCDKFLEQAKTKAPETIVAKDLGLSFLFLLFIRSGVVQSILHRLIAAYLRRKLEA